MLISASDYRTYAGLAASDTPDNTTINRAIERYQALIEGYVSRSLELDTRIDYHYRVGSLELVLKHWPVDSVASVIVDGTDLAVSGLTIDLESGIIKNYDDSVTGDLVVVTYDAGYADCPTDIKHILFTLVDGYLNDTSGGLYTLQQKRRETVFGVASVDYEPIKNSSLTNTPWAELGPYVTVLDNYRRWAIA